MNFYLFQKIKGEIKKCPARGCPYTVCAVETREHLFNCDPNYLLLNLLVTFLVIVTVKDYR